MKICVIKIDKRGRISLPVSFLKANNLDKNCNIEVRPKYNSTNEIILKFIKGEENGEQKS